MALAESLRAIDQIAKGHQVSLPRTQNQEASILIRDPRALVDRRERRRLTRQAALNQPR